MSVKKKILPNGVMWRNKMGSRNFYIIEARDSKTNQLEKRRLYTNSEQYTSIGLKQIEKFENLYKVKVTKYICNESVEILNQKPKTKK